MCAWCVLLLCRAAGILRGDFLPNHTLVIDATPFEGIKIVQREDASTLAATSEDAKGPQLLRF